GGSVVQLLPTPPSLARWLAGFCTTRLARATAGPHRAWFGGWRASALHARPASPVVDVAEDVVVAGGGEVAGNLRIAGIHRVTGVGRNPAADAFAGLPTDAGGAAHRPVPRDTHELQVGRRTGPDQDA